MIAINVRDRPFLHLGGALWLGQSAPLGWLVAERSVLLVLGQGERSLRLIPLFFGIATIATALWVGRRWLTPGGAAILVTLCSVGQWVTFYFLELKHYSADVMFALFLPAAAVWAIERHRATSWWVLASVAQWLANGALFVTPLCGMAIIASAWRRDGVRGAVRAAWPASIWLALLGLNYTIVLGPARRSELLQDAWAFAFPPQHAGLSGTVHWFAERMAPLADKPIGSGLGWLVWVGATAGFIAAAAGRRRLAFMYATVPVAGVLLAAFRLVPLYERLSLWIVPALYVGVALLADASLRSRTAIKMAGLAVVILIGADISWRGLEHLRARPRDSNHELDDRSAVAWLASRHHGGDVWTATHNSLPAIWWYAGAAARGPVVEASYRPHDGNCDQGPAAALLNQHDRVLLLLGFRFDELPAGAEDKLIGQLTRDAEVTAYRRFASEGHALIVDTTRHTTAPTTLSALEGKLSPTRVTTPPGCFAFLPAVMW